MILENENRDKKISLHICCDLSENGQVFTNQSDWRENFRCILDVRNIGYAGEKILLEDTYREDGFKLPKAMLFGIILWFIKNNIFSH